MTAHSMSFRHSSPLDLAFARVAAGIQTAVGALGRWWQAPVSSEPRNAEELMELAAHYEATQPSYAEDLRAMARRHLD